MRFSIIIPSYNQDKFIAQTLENIQALKARAASNNIQIEVLLFDNCSVNNVQMILRKYDHLFDFIEIKKDAGQYDAINKGIRKCTGDYWTWLNTDDLIDVDGFLKIASILKTDPQLDYIFGGIRYINEKSDDLSDHNASNVSLSYLLNTDPSVSQPGSFFKKEFTDQVGILGNYKCCFDYEYVLRALKHNAKIHCCNFIVARFRMHDASKTVSITPVFVKEQLEISKQYGRNLLSRHTLIANLRLLKHSLSTKK